LLEQRFSGDGHVGVTLWCAGVIRPR